MGAILFWGASSQFSNKYNDVTRYQCYGISFWQGNAALQSLGLDNNAKSQCAFLDTSSSSTLAQKMRARHFPAFLISLVEAQPTSQAFHALPPEYPLLTLAIFSLPLFAPTAWYQVVFALLMIDRKSTRLNSSHPSISYAVFCLKKKKKNNVKKKNKKKQKNKTNKN